MTERYEEIGIDEIIARTKVQLRIATTTEHDDTLELFISEGLDSLDCSSQLVKKQCCIDVCDDHMAKLPKGFVRFLGLRPICSSGSANNRSSNIIYADISFLHKNSCSTSGLCDYRDGFQINKGYIHFNSDFTADKIDIAYLGLNVDEFGRTLIYKRYERALMNYACYQFSMAFKEEYTNYQTDMWNRTWVEQRTKIIGEDIVNDFMNDRYEIAKLMNGLIVSRNLLI